MGTSVSPDTGQRAACGRPGGQAARYTVCACGEAGVRDP